MTSPQILVNAPVVAGSAATENAGAATMGATMGGAAGPVMAVMPPGSEDASAAAAAAFIARGAETEAMMAQLTVVRTLFAETMASSAAGYTGIDVINEGLLAI
jgi:PE family